MKTSALSTLFTADKAERNPLKLLVTDSLLCGDIQLRLAVLARGNLS